MQCLCLHLCAYAACKDACKRAYPRQSRDSTTHARVFLVIVGEGVDGGQVGGEKGDVAVACSV